MEGEGDMLYQKQELTEAQLLQSQRCDSFAALTAQQIRRDEDCLFSLLPYEELARMAVGWYQACSQAMLYNDFAAIDQWVRFQSDRAAAEGFALEDLIQLLRICRSSAIQVERWNEDALSDVDGIIDEALSLTSVWRVPRGLSYLPNATNGNNSSDVPIATTERTGERRSFGRIRLHLPIRINRDGYAGHHEVTATVNVSRGGLYFASPRDYKIAQILKVCYPYWTDHGAINREYSAKVSRLDSLPQGIHGVSLKFLESLDGRTGRK
jgi:PilZ domain